MNWLDIFFKPFDPLDEDKKRKMESYREEIAKIKFYFLIGLLVIILLAYIIIEFLPPSLFSFWNGIFYYIWVMKVPKKDSWVRVIKYYCDSPYFVSPFIYFFCICIVGIFWSSLVLAGHNEGSTIIALFVLPISILISFYLWKNNFFERND